MNPRRVHELMRKHFPQTNAALRTWKNIVERDELQAAELIRLLNQFIPGERVLVEVHRKLGDFLSKQEAVSFVGAHVGQGEIRIADRAFSGFVVVAQNGVAAGWVEESDEHPQTTPSVSTG